MSLYRNAHVSPIYIQRGTGLGSFLMGLFRPLIKIGKKLFTSGARTLAKKPVKRAASAIGKRALKAAANAAISAMEKKPVKKSLKKDFGRGKKEVIKALMAQPGDGLGKLTNKCKGFR